MSKIRGTKYYRPCHWNRTCTLIYCISLKTIPTTTPVPVVN